MDSHVAAAPVANSEELIAWFDSLGRSDTPTVGGKGANLAEMTRAGLPVPPGFVVTAGAFLSALDAANVRQRLLELFAAVDPDDTANLARLSEEARQVIATVPWPAALEAAFSQAYERLADGGPVAVRSSATSEDTTSTSFAGMHETFT